MEDLEETMEELDGSMEENYWTVINALSNALNQQIEKGKYDQAALQEAIDALDLECDRRIVFSEPTDEVTELKEVLEDFVDQEED